MPRDEAVDFFKAQGELYKAEIIAGIPSAEDISLYRQGDFVDLCRGAARAEHRQAQGLQAHEGGRCVLAWRLAQRDAAARVRHGLAQQGRAQGLPARLEEAEKRDHRKIGKALDLFHTQEEAPGMVFWHDKGWQIYLIIEDYIRGRLRARGYQEVHTPQIIDRSLWERSGHWDKFRENMFTTSSETATSRSSR